MAKQIFMKNKCQQDVLAFPDSSWTLEPEHGLTSKKVMISNTGNYRCVGMLDKITDAKNFTISVKGMWALKR